MEYIWKLRAFRYNLEKLNYLGNKEIYFRNCFTKLRISQKLLRVGASRLKLLKGGAIDFKLSIIL